MAKRRQALPEPIEIANGHHEVHRAAVVLVLDSDRAVGEYRDCPIDPEVMLYATDDPEGTLGIFRERLEAHGIDPANAAVLARSETMIRHLSGQAEVVKIEPNPKLVGRLAVSLANGTIGRLDVAAAQELVAYAAYDERNLDQLDPETRLRLRAATYAFIGALPPLEGDLQTWITATRPIAAACRSPRGRKNMPSCTPDAFIHSDNIAARVAQLFGEQVQFDVIVGNPLYQLDDGGFGASAGPIYSGF